jgi:hypothetical protein
VIPLPLQAIKDELDALLPANWTPVAQHQLNGTVLACGPERANEDDAVRDAFFIAGAPKNIATLLDAVDAYEEFIALTGGETLLRTLTELRNENAALQKQLAAVPIAAIRLVHNKAGVGSDRMSVDQRTAYFLAVASIEAWFVAYGDDVLRTVLSGGAVISPSDKGSYQRKDEMPE